MLLIATWTKSLKAESFPVEWPKIDYRIHKGYCPEIQEDVACYNKDSLENILIYKEYCASWQQESIDCLDFAEDIVKQPSWFESQWFYLALGLIAGMGATLAVRR